MVNERTKMAESIDTVHTHTHHILTNRIGGQSGERELYFSKINSNKINIDMKDSNKSLKN